MKWNRRSEDPPETAASDVVEDVRPGHPLVSIVDDVAELPAGARPVLVHALDGFLSAGAASRIAAGHLTAGGGRVVASFDIDLMYDYRARRPGLVFDRDHYSGYDAPRLVVRLLQDKTGVPFLLLSGPEPDFRWEGFTAAVRVVVERFEVPLVVGLGAVPMGVPHTRPVMITAHATRSELVDRVNLWRGQLLVPASAQSLLELRLGQWGHDAMGYVAHVPHYLTQVEFPSAALALLEAAAERTGLVLDLDALRGTAASAMVDIDKQVTEQEGQPVLSGLEEQYDAFTRGAEDSLLAAQGPLPTADELGQQVEQFLAGLDTGDEGD
ncbi:MAG: proteasome assembly chaperone family protein [Nocardioidaceae bacterium]